MRKLVKVAIAAGACLVLTGCPIVQNVTGNVKTVVGSFGFSSAHDVVKGETIASGVQVLVPRGASITITFNPGTEKQCDITYTNEFSVPDESTACRQKDQQDRQDRQEQDKQDQNQQQGDTSNADSGINAPEVTATPVPDYSGINAPAVTPTSAPQYSGGGGGGGIGGPQVVASAVPTYTRIMQVVSNPIVTNTLAVIGALSVAKEVHDQTNGDNGDEPVSK